MTYSFCDWKTVSPTALHLSSHTTPPSTRSLLSVFIVCFCFLFDCLFVYLFCPTDHFRVQVQSGNNYAQNPSMAPISLIVKAKASPMSMKVLNDQARSLPWLLSHNTPLFSVCSINTGFPAAPQTSPAPRVCVPSVTSIWNIVLLDIFGTECSSSLISLLMSSSEMDKGQGVGDRWAEGVQYPPLSSF